MDPLPPVYPYPYAYPPQPPRLHWGWVLALSLLTRSIFNSIWMIVQANWVRKVTGRQDPFWWAIANLTTVPVAGLLGFAFGIGISRQNQNNANFLLQGFILAIVILVLTLYVTTAFKLRSALEEPPIGIPLGGAMTFFFSGIYFQYFLRDYILPQPGAVYSGMPPPPYPPPTWPGAPGSRS